MQEKIFWIIATIIVAIPLAELSGYWLHVILHSHKSKLLGQSHMIHHMKLYGPKMPQLHKDYLSASTDRFTFFGIGPEWIVTLGTYGLLWIIAGFLVGVPWYIIFTFASTNIAWALLVHNYLHHSMHLSGFWMAKNKYTKKWYLDIRDKHVIHHLYVDDEGRMNVNYGIIVFYLDKLFGSYEPTNKKFNTKGYAKAVILYKDVLE
jgi:sterol desaturase/sphingolipid hydroxylase (fatty acid hydroxylase superfamily)